MPKIKRELSPLEVRRITKPGRYAVGGVKGLSFDVQKTGARSWVLRVVIGGIRRNVGLGGFPEVGLAQAREYAKEFKKKLRNGENPLEERRALKAELSRKHMTFSRAAKLCHEKKLPEFRNEKHGKDWISSLERYAFPIVGNMAVSEIELEHILSMLEPIWQEKTETATRLRQRLEAVLSWATVSGHRQGDNPARWKDHLDQLLPQPNKIKKVSHYKALAYQEIGAFMKQLRKRKGFGARALELSILTAARSSEIRYMTWDEIDIDNRTWTVPGDRMKTGKTHKVPLCEQAMMILENIPVLEGSQFVFPAPRGGALSDMAMTTLLRKMKVEATQHGFRSTFRDWCAEQTNYPRDVAEMALAHSIPNEVERAYRRGDLFEKRARLMQDWADYCDREQVSAEVVPIRRKEVINE